MGSDSTQSSATGSAGDIFTHQATGVLMARHDLDVDGAHAMLATMADAGGSSIESVARRLIASIGTDSQTR